MLAQYAPATEITANSPGVLKTSTTIRFSTKLEVLAYVAGTLLDTPGEAEAEHYDIPSIAEDAFQYFSHPHPGYYRIIDDAEYIDITDRHRGPLTIDPQRIITVTLTPGQSTTAGETLSLVTTGPDPIRVMTVVVSPLSQPETRRVLTWKALTEHGYLPVQYQDGGPVYQPRTDFTITGEIHLQAPATGQPDTEGV